MRITFHKISIIELYISKLIKTKRQKWVTQKHVEEKLSKKEELEKEIKEVIVNHLMNEIAQIRKLSLGFFYTANCNKCVFICYKTQILENTIFEVDQIGRSNFFNTLFRLQLSISRASRTFLSFLYLNHQ